MAAAGSDALPERGRDAKPAGKRVEVRKDKTNPRRIAYLILLLFAAPPGWPLFIFGSVLVIAAVLFHGWAAGYLARAGYQEREKILTVRGPYRHNRNPYYVAHLTMDFGFFCAAGLPLLYLVYFPIIFSVYRRWVTNEEPFLDEEFGEDYRRFKQDVPRWRIRLTPAQARGREQVFEWRLFMMNHELPRALAHLIVLGVFTFYFFLGNPFADIDPWVRVTVVGAIATWFLLHDIYPLDVSRVHLGWALPAVAAAVGGLIFLDVAPVWERWPARWSLGATVVGLALGLTVALVALPAFARVTGKPGNRIFAQPMCEWYLVGLGLGLLSLTLGGVWLGVLVPFVIWALGLAGLVPVRPVPRATAMSIVLLAGFGVFAAYSIAPYFGG